LKELKKENNMYSWSKDWPTLTELFFGEGNGPTGPVSTETVPPEDVLDELEEGSV
tara:strand:+ start:349 stop:513 length:165 start_codon:yes stop_codon:yes gene_type:complete